MKVAALTFLITISSLVCFSQSNIRVNNFWENPYYINPASINSNYKWVFTVENRKQYLGFLKYSDLPTTGNITAALNLISPRIKGRIIQLGFKMYRDKVGYTYFVDAKPSFTYSINNNSSLISFGLSCGPQVRYYDASKATFESSYDPVRDTKFKKQTYCNADFGFEYVRQLCVFGASSQNLRSIFGNNKDEKWPSNATFVYFMKKTRYEDLGFWQFGLCGIYNSGVKQAESNVSYSLNYNYRPDFLKLGAFYRTSFWTSDELGFLIGVDCKDLRISFVYEFNNGNIGRYSSGKFKGAIDVMIIWKLKKISNCKTCPLYFK